MYSKELMGAGTASPLLTDCSCHANNLISLSDLTLRDDEEFGNNKISLK